ncbi:MAG TPA: AraC family transcriptional regulator [Flavisolibacter sp.]|nr:AraC family transcriptional regulator [Flavisolibacter sp.]
MIFRLYDIVYENCLFRQFKVNELLFVEYKCLNDEQKLKVLSQDNFFIYILGGKKLWQTFHSTYEATAGQAVFVKKGANIVHQFYDEGFCALIIFVPDRFIIETIQHNEMASIPPMQGASETDSVVPLETEPVLDAYFQSVFSYFGQEQKPPAALLELKFRELIMCILASGKNQLLAGYLRSLCRENKTCLEEIMERNFIYNMRLEEFAKLTGRSLASFKRDFQSVFKTTPGRWLIQRKLQYAKHLLQISDKNINELAFDTGFESPSHFIRAFRQHYQLTPLQYRKHCRKNILDARQ